MAGHVLVGYDATAPSRTALLWAAMEAERRDAKLTVITVVDRALLAGLPPAAMAKWWRAAWELGGRRAVSGAALASAMARDVHVEPVAEVGSPRELLVSASRRADLTVLGSNGRRGARPGPVVEAVAKLGSGPLVIIGAPGSGHSGPDRPVVVGVDGSREASAALDFAASSAAAAGAPLRVVCVAGSRLTLGDQHDGSLATAERIAEAAVERSRSHSPELRVSGLAVEGEVVRILTRQAGSSRLLVVGRRGSGGQQSLVLGSVSSALLHAVPSSLAVVGVPARERDLPGGRSPQVPVPRPDAAAWVGEPRRGTTRLRFILPR